MKKFFALMMAVFVITAFGFGQAATSFKTEAGSTTATLTDADTVFMYHAVDVNVNRTLGIVATADTLTGTNAVITAKLQVSIDNVNWADIGSAKTLVEAGEDYYNSEAWYYDYFYFPRIRLMFVSTGTQTSTIYAKFFLKRY